MINKIKQREQKRRWLSKILPNSSALGKNLQAIQRRADNALNYIKSTAVIKHGERIKLDTLPWYLMVGPKGSGKTSLLSQSNVHFLAGNKVKETNSEQVATMVSSDWWITSDAVIIDVPGGFAPSNNKKSFGGELWEYLLSIVQQRQASQPLSGVVLTVSTLQLLDRNYRNRLVEYLKSRILELQHYFGKEIPFYLAITKVDMLPGFTDFFADMTLEEQMQAWGITMPEVGVSETLSSLFIKRFNALIKIINKQVIPRLHHERDLTAKANIKNFPLHVERVKDELAAILNTLAALDVSFQLNGVYLNSVMQNRVSKPDAIHCRAIWDDDPIDFMTMPGGAESKTPFFVRQFLMQGILV